MCILFLTGPAVTFDDIDIDVTTPLLPPPLLGEHTRDILRNLLKYEDSHIDELVKQKVVQCCDRKTY